MQQLFFSQIPQTSSSKASRSSGALLHYIYIYCQLHMQIKNKELGLWISMENCIAICSREKREAFMHNGRRRGLLRRRLVLIIFALNWENCTKRKKYNLGDENSTLVFEIRCWNDNNPRSLLFWARTISIILKYLFICYTNI